jgi:hypothetical protein
MLLDVLCSNRKYFNVFIVFAKIIFSFAFNRQPMADEFNRVDFLPIGFRPAYKNNL